MNADKQRDIDIKNLRFYASLFLEHKWETPQLSHGVFVDTLKGIADRLEILDKRFGRLQEAVYPGLPPHEFTEDNPTQDFFEAVVEELRKRPIVIDTVE